MQNVTCVHFCPGSPHALLASQSGPLTIDQHFRGICLVGLRLDSVAASAVLVCRASLFLVTAPPLWEGGGEVFPLNSTLLLENLPFSSCY